MALSAEGKYHAEVFAELYCAAFSLEYRKHKGQYFTPAQIAEWALSVCVPDTNDVLCDAGAGTGIFAETVLRRGIDIKGYIGVESDPILALSTAHVLEIIHAPASFRVWYGNFLTLGQDRFEQKGLPPPNMFVSNPPYVRSHNLRARDSVLERLRSSLGIDISPLSGAGNYFLCKAVDILRVAAQKHRRTFDNGRILFLLPMEAAGSAHSRHLRADLLLRHGWRSTQHVIPVKLRTPRSKALALLYVLDRPDSTASIAEIRPSGRNSLGQALRIRRGISTGCNAFFVLSDDDVKRRQIPESYLKPVMPTRIPIDGCEFSKVNWNVLRDSGHACWLLSLPGVSIEKLHPAVQEYLREGVREGLHMTATARRLKHWYSLPIPDQPADLFVTYLFRGAPRFILNSAHLLHLTNILGGWFRKPVRTRTEKLTVLECLNKEAQRWFEEGKPGREYRDGLMKIEPREMEKQLISACTASVLRRFVTSDASAQQLCLLDQKNK